MIILQNDHYQFLYRAAAVILNNGHVLLQRSTQYHFWFLPGGRVELGETAEEAVQREMFEELGLIVQVNKLCWVIENLYNHQDRQHHELNFVFLMHKPANSYLGLQAAFTRNDNGKNLEFQWVRIDQLSNLIIYPTSLVKLLNEIPFSQCCYVVERDN